MGYRGVQGCREVGRKGRRQEGVEKGRGEVGKEGEGGAAFVS